MKPKQLFPQLSTSFFEKVWPGPLSFSAVCHEQPKKQAKDKEDQSNLMSRSCC